MRAPWRRNALGAGVVIRYPFLVSDTLSSTTAGSDLDRLATPACRHLGRSLRYTNGRSHAYNGGIHWLHDKIPVNSFYTHYFFLTPKFR